jgi:hypothetical protein
MSSSGLSSDGGTGELIRASASSGCLDSAVALRRTRTDDVFLSNTNHENKEIIKRFRTGRKPGPMMDSSITVDLRAQP